jgi:hypothetical protein
MTFANRLHSLALRAYPRDFRDENQEEILGTLADLRDAHEGKGPLRQAISLSYGGNRLRWLHATGGSIAQTFRQGLAWGVMILIARQAGLGIQGVLRSLWLPFSRPSLAEFALTVGWLAVFGLLVSGRRRWGLGLLGAVLAGYAANEVTRSLGYGGPFSWPFTLHFFLPTALPLLLAYIQPPKGVRPSRTLGAAVLVLATALPPLSILFGPGLADHFARLSPGAASYAAWGVQFGLCLIVGVFTLLASLSDPRWAVVTTLVAFQPVIYEAITEIAGGPGFPGNAGLVLLVTLLPAGAWLLSLWARRRAVPRRAG